MPDTWFLTTDRRVMLRTFPPPDGSGTSLLETAGVPAFEVAKSNDPSNAGGSFTDDAALEVLEDRLSTEENGDLGNEMSVRLFDVTAWTEK
jgi:hypothetical protein